MPGSALVLQEERARVLCCQAAGGSCRGAGRDTLRGCFASHAFMSITCADMPSSYAARREPGRVSSSSAARYRATVAGRRMSAFSMRETRDAETPIAAARSFEWMRRAVRASRRSSPVMCRPYALCVGLSIHELRTVRMASTTRGEHRACRSCDVHPRAHPAYHPAVGTRKADDERGTFGAWLVRKRSERGWSGPQAVAALQASGRRINESYYYALESGGRKPGVPVVAAFERLYGERSPTREADPVSLATIAAGLEELRDAVTRLEEEVRLLREGDDLLGRATRAALLATRADTASDAPARPASPPRDLGR